MTLVISGCAGGQTGSEEWNGRDVGGKDPCEELSMPLADDTASALGFSAAEVAALASGPRSAEMVWGSLSPDLSVGPEQGLSSIELELFPKAGSARFVQHSPRASSGMASTIGCPQSELRFDAELAIASAGGALNERRNVVVQAQSSQSVSLRADLPWSELRGSLWVTPAAGLSVVAPNLSVQIDAEQTRGTLTGLVEEHSGNSVGARNVTYACWPSGSADCAPP